jgi:hypothetical protein
LREGEALPERSAVDIAMEEAGGDPRKAIELPRARSIGCPGI